MSFKVCAFSAGRENVHAVLFISVMRSPLSSFCFNYTEKYAKKSPRKLQKSCKIAGDVCLVLVFGVAAIIVDFIVVTFKIHFFGNFCIVKQS